MLCGKILVHFNTLTKIKTYGILAQISFAPLWYISKGQRRCTLQKSGGASSSVVGIICTLVGIG